MNKTMITSQQRTLPELFSPVQASILQRKCACGNHTMAGGECADCAKKKMGLQRKLTIGASNDPLEQEADRIADQVMASPGHGVVSGARVKVQRFTGSPLEQEMEVPPSVERVLAGLGQSLEPGLREKMEGRFGYDFSRVRVHTGDAAEQSARDVNAHAYTVGNNVVFGTGKFAPGTHDGQRLIAHELVHSIQQSHSIPKETLQRYTEEEQRAMVEGRVRAREDDLAMASARHFEPGDIVFRLGSYPLGLLTGQPVTHGGIYIGDGLIHDVVGFGNRYVPVTNFFNPDLNEAADATIYRVARFHGPLHSLIINRLLENIRGHVFRMPTDPVPFNLFSSADDYRTATCLEYAHAQFLYAIYQLVNDPSIQDSDRQILRQTYFTGSSTEPNPLIQPQRHRIVGGLAARQGFRADLGRFGTSRTPSARLEESLLVGGASYMASDVNPSVFQNRSEAQYTEHWPGGEGIGGRILNLFAGPTSDEVALQTFTYQSFVDSRQFFRILPSP